MPFNNLAGGSLNLTTAASFAALPLANCADENFTMACWVFPVSTGSTRWCMDVSNSVNSQGVRLGMSTGVLFQQISSGGTLNRGGATITGNRWSHIAATAVGSNVGVSAHFAVYLNGRRINTGAGLSSGTYTTPTTTKIGVGTGSGGADSAWLWGNVTEAGFWNRALSLEEIQLLASGAPASDIPAQLACYVPLHQRKRGVQLGDLTKCWRTGTNFYISGGRDPPQFDEYDQRQEMAAINSALRQGFSATVALTLGSFAAAGGATFTPKFSATASAVLPPAAVNASAAFTAPVGVTATAAALLGPIVANAAAEFDPQFRAAVSVTMAPLAAASSAEFDAPVFTATAALNLGRLTASSAATFATATFTATVVATLGRIAVGAGAEFDAPVFTATASASLGAVVVTTSAEFDAPTFTATAATTLGRITVASSSEFDVPVFTATSSATLGPLVAAVDADFASMIFTSAASLVLAPLDAAGTASATPPFVEAVAAIVLPGIDVYALAPAPTRPGGSAWIVRGTWYDAFYVVGSVPSPRVLGRVPDEHHVVTSVVESYAVVRRIDDPRVIDAIPVGE
jgi:hypothetical protein